VPSGQRGIATVAAALVEHQASQRIG